MTERTTQETSNQYIENISTAIVRQAIEDYFDLLSGFIMPSADCNELELKNFFRSRWFSDLSDLNAEFLIKMIKEKAALMVRKYEISRSKNKRGYYVHAVGDETPLTEIYSKKIDAVTKAAELNGISVKEYKRVCRRDGVKC